MSVVNSSGAELCAGVLLGPFSVLTAARCLHLQDSDPQPSNFFVGLGIQLNSFTSLETVDFLCIY